MKQQIKQTSLSVLDRYLLTIGLPTQGNYKTLATCKFLAAKIKLNETETKDLFKRISPAGDFAPTAEMIDEVKKYEINDDEKQVIKDALKALDEKWLLSSLHMDLYEKFMDMTDKIAKIEEEKSLS